MKKLIFFLIFGLSVLSLQSQTQTGRYPLTEFTWDSIKIPVTDTVITFTKTGELTAFNITPEFDFSRLDSSIILWPGGSNNIIRTTPRLWGFQPARNDSFPYTILRLKWRQTINGVVQNRRDFPFTMPQGKYYFALYIKRDGCTAGKYLLYNFRYFKP